VKWRTKPNELKKPACLFFLFLYLPLPLPNTAASRIYRIPYSFNLHKNLDKCKCFLQRREKIIKKAPVWGFSLHIRVWSFPLFNPQGARPLSGFFSFFLSRSFLIVGQSLAQFLRSSQQKISAKKISNDAWHNPLYRLGFSQLTPLLEKGSG
jgi:hypothetical protein